MNLKEIAKENLRFIVLVSTLFIGGGVAYGAYDASNNETTTTPTTQTQPTEQPSQTEPSQEITPAPQTDSSGGGNIVNKNPEVKEKAEYVVYFNLDSGVITEVKEKTGNEVGNFIITDSNTYKRMLKVGIEKWHVTKGTVGGKEAYGLVGEAPVVKDNQTGQTILSR